MPHVIDTPSLSEFEIASSVLTGFDIVDIQATGMSNEYLDYVTDHAPAANAVAVVIANLWAHYGGNLDEIEPAVEAKVWSDPSFSAAARALTVLWYTGAWYPDADSAGGTLLSAASYQQGLMWPAVGTKPLGARPGGYASWALPPASPTVARGAR